MPGCRVITDIEFRGIETIILENSALRVVVLVGKGGDIIEFRDKRTDVNCLYESEHEWRTPGETYVSPTGSSWMDYYPGGWQDLLPLAGSNPSNRGAAYAMHGETAQLPWKATVVEDSAQQATVKLTVELTRYPFMVEKTLSLEEGQTTLHVEETVTNLGEIDLEFLWVQHLVLGAPLLAPGAELSIEASEILTEKDPISPNSRLPGDRRFEWPTVETRTGETANLSTVPEEDAQIHDLAYLLDLTDGRFSLVNEDLDLGFGLQFDETLFECLWFWESYNGFEASPYFNRAWNLGIEPATGYPEWDVPDAARENGSIDILDAGEAVTSEYRAATFESGLEVSEKLS